MTNITIAGASGYVGRHLLKNISLDFNIRGLSRGDKDSDQANLTWMKTDLFSFKSTEESLVGTDIAIYLVHSMMPSTRLFQGDFKDADLLIADNFARACKRAGVKQIIYLGGLLPEANVSKHLMSRLEVERVLKATEIPLTILRAGMIVGDGGSSFEILKNLVFNLPGMILPKWTQSNTQAFFIDDLVNIIIGSIGNKDFENKTIDVVNGESLTYKDLILETTNYFGKKKLFIPLPINSTAFSKLWVKIFGETDYELVSPLIDSLTCDLPFPEVNPLIEPYIKYRTYKEMLKKISTKKIKKKKNKGTFSDNTVRSIQRLENTQSLTSKYISDSYIKWLPRYMKSLLMAKTEGKVISFFAFGIPKPLLKLEHVEDSSNLDREKFHIIGGILSHTSNTGWLEFRRVANGEFTLASINEFIPSLPWYVYKYTQAPIHAHVMKSFGRFLSNKSI
ncbi:MAG: nucleoside-diphosphate-sugar epimerase [Bacteriovoracaceae bacterium]|jgi:nucleoside-diphosphate-sugar epimerase